MSHILNLIERQLAMSNVKDRLAAAPSRLGQYVAEDGTIYGPCLLISRECGSGGSLVAQRTGELLGWNVFDTQIVDEIARNAHVHQHLVQSVDERVHSSWERTWRNRRARRTVFSSSAMRGAREAGCAVGDKGEKGR